MKLQPTLLGLASQAHLCPQRRAREVEPIHYRSGEEWVQGALPAFLEEVSWELVILLKGETEGPEFYKVS